MCERGIASLAFPFPSAKYEGVTSMGRVEHYIDRRDPVALMVFTGRHTTALELQFQVLSLPVVRCVGE